MITLIDRQGKEYEFSPANKSLLGGKNNSFYYQSHIGFFEFLEKTAVNNTAKIDVIARPEIVSACMMNSRIGGKANFVVAMSEPKTGDIVEFLFNKDFPIPADWISFDTVKQEFFLRASSTNYKTLITRKHKLLRRMSVSEFTNFCGSVRQAADNGDYSREPQNLGHMLEILHCKGTTAADKLTAWNLKDSNAKYDGQYSFYSEDGKRHCLTVDFKCAISIKIDGTTKKVNAYGKTHGIKYTCFMPTFLMG